MPLAVLILKGRKGFNLSFQNWSTAKKSEQKKNLKKKRLDWPRTILTSQKIMKINVKNMFVRSFVLLPIF